MSVTGTGNRPTPGRGDVSAATIALLGSRGTLSRAAIATHLGVSQATITQATRDLLERGLVVELDTVPSNGGRPARLLGLASPSACAIGVKVTADHVAAVSVGLDGIVTAQSTHPLDTTSPTAIDDLSRLLADLVARAPGTVLGVGVCLPGAVDAQASGIVTAPTLHWTAAQVGPLLRGALGVPVLVENDVNALAVAESLYGTGRGHRSFAVLTIGRGIGAGFIVDGQLHRGAGGGAGEIGHFPVSDDGPPCECGNHGCLEAVIGQAALEARAVEQGVLAPTGTIAGLVGAADDGDPTARAIFHDAGTLLGRTVAGLVHLLDPAMIVLLGEGIDAWPHWRRGFEPAFRAHLMPARRAIPFVVEPWADDKWALGAASLVLATPFDALGSSGEQGRLVIERLQAEPGSLATTPSPLTGGLVEDVADPSPGSNQ